MEIKIENNKLSFSTEVKFRRPIQKWSVMQLIKNGNIEELYVYINTFKGKRNRSASVFRNKSHGIDELSERNKNHWAKRFQQLCDPSRNHKPNNSSSDWFGVEIECFVPYSVIEENSSCSNCNGVGSFYNDETDDSDECSECEGSGKNNLCGISALKEVFKAKKIKYCQVKTDGSIEPSDDHFGVEIAILTRYSDTSNLKQACDLLASLGAKVNKSCGMHVHLDARHLNGAEVVEMGKNFAKSLPVLLAMVPETRRTNSYCRPRVSTIKGDRYSAVNLTAFEKYRTVEIRLHSSTTNFDKIMNWANLLNAIAKAEIKKNCSDINQLTEYIDISQELLEYIGQRTALFSPDANCSSVAAVDTDSTEVMPLEVAAITQRHELHRIIMNDLNSAVLQEGA